AVIAASTAFSSAATTLPTTCERLAGVGTGGCVPSRSRPATEGRRLPEAPGDIFSSEVGELPAIRKIGAGGVHTCRPKQVARQRNARMRNRVERLYLCNWVGRDLGGWQALMDDAIDERSVGAILEEPPHKIRQQIRMRSDGRVDSARQILL